MTGHYTENVRVNAIAPSRFESNIGDLIHREPGYEERSMRRVPFGRAEQRERRAHRPGDAVRGR
jgi:hypothetical protein